MGDVKSGETVNLQTGQHRRKLGRLISPRTSNAQAVSTNDNPPTSARPSNRMMCAALHRNMQKHRIKSRCDNNRTTIQSRSRELADNVTNNNALLRRLKRKGNVRTFSGGNVILEELMYGDASTVNANSYSGYETLNISPNSPISAAQFGISQYAAAITMSGLEMLQNSGKEQMIDLMEGRVKVAEAQLQNRISQDIYLDGTGNGGKNLTGLAAAVPDDGTTGTYGGISRSTWSFWQPVDYSAVTDGGAATSAANIQQYMTTVALRLVRGTNKADLIVADTAYYALYVNSLQAIQRVAGEEEAGAGFSTLKFYGGGTSADVVLDGGIYKVTTGATAAHMWFLDGSHSIH